MNSIQIWHVVVTGFQDVPFLLRKIHLPFLDHSYMLVPSNSLANVEKRFKVP